MADFASRPQKQMDDDEEFLEETYLERLVGLSEMVPEPVRNAACKSVSLTKSGVIALFGISKTLSWVIVSSGIVALMPYNMESMRQEMIDTQLAQEKSILLGPNVGMTGQNMSAEVPMPVLPGQQAAA